MKNKLRRIALGMKGAIESAHMGHPDFRVNGHIFATLRDGDTLGMVKHTPEQQQEFISRDPAFVPETGAWGRQGCTAVRLGAVDEEILGEALTVAYQNLAKQKSRAPVLPRTRRRRDA